MQSILQPDGIVIHTTGVYVLDKQGRERVFLDEGFDPKVLSSDLHLLLNEHGAPVAVSTAAVSGPPAGTVAQSQIVNGYTVALTATPGQFGTYTFTAEVQDAQGVPMQGATVTAGVTMPSMSMAPLNVTLGPLSPPIPGAYRAQGVLSMAGSWQVVLTVKPSNGAQPLRATFKFTAKY